MKNYDELDGTILMKLYNHVGPDNIAELLRRNRHVAGLSVREAAEQAGVSHATFSRVENDGKPSLTTYFKLRAWVAGPSPEGDCHASAE